MRFFIFLFFCFLSKNIALCTTPLWMGNGRIIVSCDGNEHDWDDWAATAMNLAVLSSQKLQEKVPIYIYSDHIWGSNQERSNVKGMSAYEHMRESALKGAAYFKFNNTRMICAVDNPEVAYEALKEEINKSSKDNPLFIIAAGPMQVVGEALNRSAKDKRKYVTVISHSGWNNNHSDNPQKNLWWDIHTGWTFKEMIDNFSTEDGGKCNFVKIPDQNLNLQRDRKEYDWLRLSPARSCPYYNDGSWDWLYSRLESCAVKKGRFFDVSDTGMILFLLTGNNRATPAILKELLESPLQCQY